MLKQYTYRKKLHLLFVGIIVFMLLCYKLAVKPTVELIGENSSVDKGLAALDTIPSKIAAANHKLAAYDSRIKTSFSDRSVQSFVLEYVVDYCGKNNIVIKEFPQPSQSVVNDYLLETNRLILKGDFSKILYLVYCIEQKYHVGKVSSLRFYKYRNSNTNSVELLADIYLQTIKKNTSKVD